MEHNLEHSCKELGILEHSITAIAFEQVHAGIAVHWSITYESTHFVQENKQLPYCSTISLLWHHSKTSTIDNLEMQMSNCSIQSAKGEVLILSTADMFFFQNCCQYISAACV